MNAVLILLVNALFYALNFNICLQEKEIFFLKTLVPAKIFHCESRFVNIISLGMIHICSKIIVTLNIVPRDLSVIE